MSTGQIPIHSGFDSLTTVQDVMRGHDLRGRTAIVTGGYSGLGREAARALANAGARVLVPARDRDKAATALEGIDGVELGELDLMNPTSIDSFADAYVASERRLDLLLNCAGIMAAPLQRDSRGYESQFSTNHLGHFQLTARLWPALRRAEGARVVSVSSLGHRLSPVDFDDPNFMQRPYDKWIAYGQSKTANALFAVAADHFGAPEGIRAFSLHPGAIFTPLTRHLNISDYQRVGAADANGNILSTEQAGFKTVEQGAATLVWCAISQQLEGLGGVYCEDCDIAKLADASTERAGVRPWAVDRALALRLWTLSEQLTGVSLPSR